MNVSSVSSKHLTKRINLQQNKWATEKVWFRLEFGLRTDFEDRQDLRWHVPKCTENAETCRDYQIFTKSNAETIRDLEEMWKKLWKSEKKNQKIQKIQKIWTKVMKIRKWSLCEVGRLKDSHSPQPWRGRLGHDAVGSAVNGACSIARIRRWLWWLWWLPCETSWNFTARINARIPHHCGETVMELHSVGVLADMKFHPWLAKQVVSVQYVPVWWNRKMSDSWCVLCCDGWRPWPFPGHWTMFGTSFRTCFIPEPSFYPVRMFSFDPVPFPYVLMSSLWLGSHYSQLVWALCCRRKESNPGMFFPGPQGLSKNQMMTCTCCVMLLHA